jgi:hypothetical protein
VYIYVLPTVPNNPPRAALMPREPVPGEPAEGTIVTWSSDLGAWMQDNGLPVPNSLGEAITAHAKNLGVEWGGDN